MALKSRQFTGDKQLEAAAVSNPAHIQPGAKGAHVSKIQRALILLDDATMSPHELRDDSYGTTTARAVLAYKTKRKIINHSYQTQADNIVGVMTIASLDLEMLKHESRIAKSRGCGDQLGGGGSGGGRVGASAVPSTAPRAFVPIKGSGTGPGTGTIVPATLNVVMMWTTAGLADKGSRRWRYFEKAKEILAPLSLTLNVIPSPGEVPSNVMVTPNNRYDIWSVRKAAEKVMPGQPTILKIIACPFEKMSVPYFALTESGTVDGVTFPDFILLNTREVRPDQCVVIHEMLHATKRADGNEPTLIDRWHHDKIDPDPANIYTEASNRSVLKFEYAQALSEAFFARR